MKKPPSQTLWRCGQAQSGRVPVGPRRKAQCPKDDFPLIYGLINSLMDQLSPSRIFCIFMFSQDSGLRKK